MTRRIEAGPVLVGIGALVLLVSVFLDWYQPNVTAWEAFEVVDLLLVALGIAALLAAAGAIRPEATVIERHWLPAIVAAIAIIVAAQILDPPPSVDGDPTTGAWLALGAALVMCLGTLLTLGRVSFALTVEGRDTRRRVSAVDARTDPTTSEGPAVAPTGKTRVMENEKE
jgi:peptidoglycan/LPS O-acetylase OafA/YrhL